MNNSHVREPFQSILNDLRDGMAALERSAQPKRTSMQIKAPVRHYDPKCEELAAAFLVDHPPFSRFEKEDLAQAIQDAIEDWFIDRENRALEDK